MKTFEITVSGKTLEDVISAIDEAKSKIESGFLSGADKNDNGRFNFISLGSYHNVRKNKTS